MKSIVHLINDLDTGGAQRALIKLLASMDRDRFAPHVLTLLPGGALRARVEELEIPVDSLGMRRGVASPVSALGFRRRLKHWKPDILQTWMYHANLLGLLAGRAARRMVWNVRSAVTPGQALPGGWANRLCARLARRPSAVVVNSRAGRDSHDAIGYRPRRWEVLPNGFDIDRYAARADAGRDLRRELDCPEDSVLFATFARWHPTKGHAVALDAFRAVAERCPHANLVLAGTDVDADNVDLAASLDGHNGRTRIHLLGERRDMARLMAGVDVVVSPSYCEGFPNVLGEAMAAETPCVATDAGGSAEVLGGTGRIVPVGEPDALAHAMMSLLDAGRNGREELGRAARQRVEREFEIGVVARRYERFYEELLGN